MIEYNKILARGCTQSGLEENLLFLVVNNQYKVCSESAIR